MTQKATQQIKYKKNPSKRKENKLLISLPYLWAGCSTVPTKVVARCIAGPDPSELSKIQVLIRDF